MYFVGTTRSEHSHVTMEQCWAIIHVSNLPAVFHSDQRRQGEEFAWADNTGDEIQSSSSPAITYSQPDYTSSKKKNLLLRILMTTKIHEPTFKDKMML